MESKISISIKLRVFRIPVFFFFVLIVYYEKIVDDSQWAVFIIRSYV